MDVPNLKNHNGTIDKRRLQAVYNNKKRYCSFYVFGQKNLLLYGIQGRLLNLKYNPNYLSGNIHIPRLYISMENTDYLDIYYFSKTNFLCLMQTFDTIILK